MSIQQLRGAAAEWDLLKHSFYRRWTNGELTMPELRDYACQYAFVVRAMPRWLADAAAADTANGETLEAHAREEAAHVEMWSDFATAVGVPAETLSEASPNAATRRLMDLGDELVAGGLGAAAVWALEAQTPAVSVEKLAGLGQYGVAAGPGTHYFEVHRTMDVRHSDELEMVIASGADRDGATRAAASMSEALWGILTSVETAPAHA